MTRHIRPYSDVNDAADRASGLPDRLSFEDWGRGVGRGRRRSKPSMVAPGLVPSFVVVGEPRLR